MRQLKNLLHYFESLAASWIYRFPTRQLTVIGVTGTDGKTTTSSLIHHILTVAGYKTAILSTLSSPHMTTPGRFAVQSFLRRSLNNKCTHAVLEVTSIAVDQHRIGGVNFAIGVLTNIADHEHLDYHRTFANYRQAKICFLLSCPVIVANADDPSFDLLKSKVKTQKLVDYKLSDWQTYQYKTQLLGDFNRSNILAAAAAARTLSVDEKTIEKAISSFVAPPGRLEMVATKPFTVIVDFAHTPQAFEKILPVAKTLKAKPKSKLIHVFGATGNRDKSKRPIMAWIAAKHDDYIFLTHEDTYHEDPKKILAQLEAGLSPSGHRNYEVVTNRKEAIRKALAMAQPGDVVLITGVGHQRSMNIAGKEVPWNEPKIVKELLSERQN